jgi:hypothetical protein
VVNLTEREAGFDDYQETGECPRNEPIYVASKVKPYISPRSVFFRCFESVSRLRLQTWF